MKDARHATRSERLLFERERDGVRTLTLVRGGFVLVATLTVWIIGASLFEKIATSAMAGLVLFGIGGGLFLVRRDSAVGLIGLTGCLVDVALLATLPIIWYLSVGGASIPPAFMLKTQITVVTLALVALNALAIRPLYPVLVAIGGVCVHIGLLVYALLDARTVASSDFVSSAMGSALNLELVATSMLIIALVGAAMAYLTWIARLTVIQAVQLEVANTQFGRYFSPGVVSRISSDAEDLLGVGGRTQEVAVLFCDIRDFTALTENLSPSEAVGFLSDYHERMVAVIFEYGGTIDKFIGDAIMVTFGTPDPQDDDAVRSVLAGIAMNAALTGLNSERELDGLTIIRHGIGIHYGPVIAGNIGTEARLEYTVIGDTVNVASRIQDACKASDEALLVSEAVKLRLPADIQVRTLPEQKVRGRQASVRIYAVDGHSSQL